MKKIFKYIEPMWLGYDKQVSIRRVLALMFSFDIIVSMQFIIRNWEIGKSYSEAAILLGIEAGLVAALLSLTTYSSTHPPKKDIE